MRLQPAMPWEALVRGERAPGQWTLDLEKLFDAEAFGAIRCPRCRWRPSPSCRWTCYWHAGAPEPAFESCGTSWNTFETRGRCPGCGHQWRWTSCLSCGEWSPHEDWYEKQVPSGSRQ